MPGRRLDELTRRNGIHANTIRLCRSKYRGTSTFDLARLKQLEAENPQMQRIIARQTVKVDAIGAAPKKLVGPSRRFEAVKALQLLGLSQREACTTVRARRRSASDKLTTKEKDDSRLAGRLTAVARAHSDHGCRRLYADYERDAEVGIGDVKRQKTRPGRPRPRSVRLRRREERISHALSGEHALDPATAGKHERLAVQRGVRLSSVPLLRREDAVELGASLRRARLDHELRRVSGPAAVQVAGVAVGRSSRPSSGKTRSPRGRWHPERSSDGRSGTTSSRTRCCL